MNGNNIVQLDDENKAMTTKTLKDIMQTSKYLFDLIQKDKLTDDMKDKLPNLLEYRFRDLSKYLSYDGDSKEKIEERFAEIRRLNEENNDLKKKLGNTITLDAVKERLYNLSQHIEEYWDEAGFNFVDKVEFLPNGSVRVTFGFMIDSVNDFKLNRYQEEEKVKENVLSLLEQGFKLEKDESQYHLVDSIENKRLLKEMLKKRFPSINFYKWSSFEYQEKNCEIIHEVITYITNIEDILPLTYKDN